MFGRRRREEEASEASREEERRALFEQLAKRPETVCPFLGMASDRAGYQPEASDGHRCYAFGDPAELSHDQQTRVCLQRGYGNCPRYLRGVLVIPTEEIEALRRPAPPPVAVATPAAGGARRRRPPVVIGALALLLLIVSGGGAFLLLGGGLGPVAAPTDTPTPQATPTPASTPTPAVTAAPTPSPTPAQTADATPTPEPTPEAFDTFSHYEVSVAPGDYTVYQFAASGAITTSRPAVFDSFSQGQAQPASTAGVVHWVIQEGAYSGFSYRAPDSGPFRVRAVFTGPGGERRSYFLEDDELTEFPEGTPVPEPAP